MTTRRAENSTGRSSRSGPVVEVDYLTKRYGAILAVDDLSFTVAAGQVTGFLGPNGSGKSTTMRTIIGLDAPSAGQVTIAGRSYGWIRFPSSASPTSSPPRQDCSCSAPTPQPRWASPGSYLLTATPDGPTTPAHGAARRATGAAVIGSAAAAYLGWGRSWQLRWGATDAEVGAPLAGDDLIAAPDLMATRAITVSAPADKVWPWIAQLGQGRGGFYTYDWLENLVGLDMHSATRIVPEWQNIQAGDQVRLAAETGLAVTVVDRGRALVIRGAIPMGPVPCPYDFTWCWILREQRDGTTRLVVRERYGYTRRWAPFLIEPVQVISFIMTQRMLRGIKERAETGDRPAAPAGPAPTRAGQGQMAKPR